MVGGGAAGLMAAGRAAELGAHVELLERNSRLALKLRITGKGRCNITSTAPMERFVDAFAPNGRFLYGPLSRFSPEDLRSLLHSLGVETVEERGQRVFPAGGSALEVADVLERWARRNGARILPGRRALSLLIDRGMATGVRTQEHGDYPADSVIIATGGLSYPRTGSTGDGYEIARQAGHTIIQCRPSLVPLETRDQWPKQMQGVSLRNVTATVLHNGRRAASEFGEMLFTHFGISGPIILTLSRTVVPLLGSGQVQVSINLKPALTQEKLEARLLRDFRTKRHFRRYAGELAPRALGPILAQLSGISEDQPLNSITTQQRHALMASLTDLRATVSRARPIEEAIVTAGGVALKEVDPRRMESRLVTGLYFAGEVLDLDAVTGGYNLQAAFSTGWVAGEAAAQSR